MQIHSHVISFPYNFILISFTFNNHRYAREFESGSDHETQKRSPKMIAEMLFEMPPSVERLIDKVVDNDDIEYMNRLESRIQNIFSEHTLC